MVVVSEETARKFWPMEDAAKSIRVERPSVRHLDNLPGVTQATLIGVAEDVAGGWVM